MIMNTLRTSKDRIFDVKNQVDTNSRGIYTHTVLNDRVCDDGTVSIVMTSSNRSPQVYYTLKTIAQSAYKNVQVIVVDDSTHDPVLSERLAAFPFTLDFIQINRAVKCWHNPLVNYNIGFKFVRGGKILIQNGEVCHTGDVISHLVANLPPNTYSAYDVRTMPSYAANDIIYKMPALDVGILSSPHVGIWYQGRTNNRNFHFLAGFDRQCLEKIGGFSYDYTFGSDFDDDDFVLRIRGHRIKVESFFSDTVGCGGIHLFHGLAPATWNKGVEWNKGLFDAKMRFFASSGVYIDVTTDADLFENQLALLG